MKRFIVAIALLLSAVVLCISCYFIFNSKIEALQTSLEDLLVTAENNDKVLLVKKTDDIMALWKINSPVLHMLVHHCDMDDLEPNITGLKLFLKDNNLELYKECCINGINQLENLRNAEQPIFDNIL